MTHRAQIKGQWHVNSRSARPDSLGCPPARVASTRATDDEQVKVPCPHVMVGRLMADSSFSLLEVDPGQLDLCQSVRHVYVPLCGFFGDVQSGV